ncbi:DNA-directed RNA polymerase 2B, chloroplastic/mitochondrial, partial [Tanacetum coccineum]
FYVSVSTIFRSGAAFKGGKTHKIEVASDADIPVFQRAGTICILVLLHFVLSLLNLQEQQQLVQHHHRCQHQGRYTWPVPGYMVAQVLATILASGTLRLIFGGKHDHFIGSALPGTFAVVGVPPAIMGIGPAIAIPAALKATGLKVNDIDLFEINEHYAALGRDKLGASAVNLVEGERPADVYLETAARVLDVVKRDAELDPVSFPMQIMHGF